MKKLFVYLSALFLFSVKPVFAAVPGPSFNLDGVFNILGDVLGNISTLFAMGWIGDNMEGFLKFLLWVLVFSILYTVGLLVFAKYGGDGSSVKRIALVVSLVLATGTTLATPASLIATVFASYATVIIFALMGGAIALVVWVLYGDWLKELISGPGLHFIRIIGLLLCWFILAIVSSSFDTMLPGGMETFAVLPLLLIKIRRGY